MMLRFALIIICLSAVQAYGQKKRSIVDYYTDIGYQKSEFKAEGNKWIFTKYYHYEIIESIVTVDTLQNKKTETVFFMSGTPVYSILCIDDLLMGPFTEYYPSGILKRSGEYYHNFKVGKWNEYFDNGNKKSEGNYIISKKDSFSLINDEFFRLNEKRIYYDTIIYGQDFIVHDTFPIEENGIKKMQAVTDTLFRKDIRANILSKKDDIWTYWHQDSAIMRKEYYRDGILKKKEKY